MKTLIEKLRQYTAGDDFQRATEQAADAIEHLKSVNEDLLAACYAVLHDCEDIDMVKSNEPGRDKGPWEMLNEAIAYAEGNKS